MLLNLEDCYPVLTSHSKIWECCLDIITSHGFEGKADLMDGMMDT